MILESLRWLGFGAGAAIVVATFGSIITTIITPRMISSRITYAMWTMVRQSFMVMANRLRRYESKDRLLALLAPVSLLFTLLGWLFLFLLGYALMFWPFIGGGFGAALYLSGSSIFTLGVASSPRAGPIVLEFAAAATGLIAVALQIGYLPTIYSAYNRRETLVTSLSSRAGAPAWGPEVLARHNLAGTIETLPALYAAWENWAADMAESHASYPWLMSFRSPDPMHSWIVSLLAVLDSAALYLALAPKRAPAEARQCLRMGYVGLRTLARVLSIPANNDPRPDDPIVLTFDEFSSAVELLRRAGFPIERTAEDAWPHYRGWRVNYETTAHQIAAYVVAAPAPWSGERRLLTHEEKFAILANRPRHRTPDDPDGARVLATTIFTSRQASPDAQESASAANGAGAGEETPGHQQYG